MATLRSKCCFAASELAKGTGGTCDAQGGGAGKPGGTPNGPNGGTVFVKD